ncbi:ATP/GTP-binding protein [Streptomyces sp. NPDC005408]|uniref:ATP/GTP-binding protein n=1 Tax=Streptomyces sp. NPDC005408 TaxID=3155341 RepID=UPI0033B7DDF1
MDPQPPAGSPMWEGHQPGDGAVYVRGCLNGAAQAIDIFWAAPPPADAGVDPAVLAQQAVDKMTLTGPDININPKPGGKGLVGMPVWMAANQGLTTWGPNTASASAGGITVTATATVSKVVWQMGDGTTVACAGPGTVYKTSYGLKDSPDCGHVYNQPSSKSPAGTYKVTATATWSVDWVAFGGGAAGQLTEVRDSDVELTIVESQAVN